MAQATDKPTIFTVDELDELAHRLEARGKSIRQKSVANDMLLAAQLIKHLIMRGKLSVHVDAGFRPYITIDDGEGK